MRIKASRLTHGSATASTPLRALVSHRCAASWCVLEAFVAYSRTLASTIFIRSSADVQLANDLLVLEFRGDPQGMFQWDQRRAEFVAGELIVHAGLSGQQCCAEQGVDRLLEGQTGLAISFFTRTSTSASRVIVV
jgi:hypothetical protein